jgi:peptide/nickel transport system permease protein
MSPRRRAAQPAFATEGAGDATTAWEAMPRRRLASLGKWRNPIGIVGAAIIVFNVLVALFGPYVWTVDPDELVGLRFESLSWAHPMGTDEIGRDTLARVIHGAKVSLYVGAISVSIAFVGGVIFGMLAGYYKGIVDTLLMRIVDIMFSLPGIVLAIVIAGLLGPNRRNAMIAIGIVILPAFARVVRGAVLEVMGYPYTESARALGAGGWRIMLRHVIPNIGAPLLVLVTVYLSVAILAEAALSFLGLGTQPPEA